LQVLIRKAICRNDLAAMIEEAGVIMTPEVTAEPQPVVETCRSKRIPRQPAARRTHFSNHLHDRHHLDNLVEISPPSVRGTIIHLEERGLVVEPSRQNRAGCRDLGRAGAGQVGLDANGDGQGAGFAGGLESDRDEMQRLGLRANLELESGVVALDGGDPKRLGAADDQSRFQGLSDRRIPQV
jgi:hypothetical protein